MFVTLTKRIREERLFLEVFHKTSSFFIEGMVGIGKTKFVFDLVESFESLGYSFHYVSVTSHLTINMLLLQTAFELGLITEEEKDKPISFEDSLHRIIAFLKKNKTILCFDNFGYITGDNALSVLKTLNNVCVDSSKKSKLIIISRHQITISDQNEFPNTFRIELQGLDKKDSERLIQGFFELHNYTEMSLEEIKRLTDILDGNPLLMRMACLLLAIKQYPKKNFLSQQFLNQEDFIKFIYDNYLSFYDIKTLELLKLLSCYNIPVEERCLKAVFTDDLIVEPLAQLKHDLLVHETRSSQIKLKSIFKHYCFSQLSEVEKKKFFSLCLSYFKNEENHLKPFDAQKEIFSCLMYLEKYKEAESTLLAVYRKLIEVGDHEIVLDMIENLSQKIDDMDLQLKMARIEIIELRRDNDKSLELIEDLEESLGNTKCLDLMLFKVRVLQRRYENKSQIFEVIDTLIHFIELCRFEKKPSYILHYKDVEILETEVLNERLRVNLNPYEGAKDAITRDIQKMEELLENRRDTDSFLPFKALLLLWKARAFWWLDGEAKKACTPMAEALSLYESLNYKEKVAYCTYALGTYYYCLDGIKKSFKYLKKAIVLSTTYNYPHILALCYRNYGLLYSKRGNFPKALEYFQKTCSILGLTSQFTWTIFTQLDLVSVLIYLEQYDQAHEQLDDIEKNQYVTSGIMQRNFMMLTRQRLLFSMRLDQKEEVEKYAKIFIESRSKERDLLIEADILNALTAYYIYSKNYSEAQAFAMKVKNLLEKKEIGKFQLAEAYFTLARVNFYRDHYKEASRYTQLSLKLSKKYRWMYIVSKTYLLQAQIQYKEKKILETKKILFEVITIAKTNSYVYHQVQAHLILANINVERGKLKLGYESVMEALKLAIAQSYYDLIALCYKLLSYFFKYPLSDLLLDTMRNELKIQSLDDIEVLYEKYFDQVTEQQKDFISLFKEPDFESRHYSFHITKDSGIDTWDDLKYTTFIQNGMNNCDVVVNVAAGYIYCKDKGKLELDRHHLLFRLLVYLIRNKEKVVSKKELINSVWHEEYDPLMHDQLIYVTVNKLRRQIEGGPDSKEVTFIRNNDEGYCINKKTKFCLIERSLSMDGDDLNSRQKWVLEYLVNSGKITNKEFVNYFKINRTTAFQELDDLVSKNLLERRGAGRSTYYTFRNKASA